MMTYEIKKQVYELTKEHILEPSRFNSNDLMPVISSIWNVYNLKNTEDKRYNNLGDEIDKHFFMNDDWDEDKLFIGKLHLLDDDHIFLTFIEKLLNLYVSSPLYNAYKEAIRPILSNIGIHISEITHDNGQMNVHIHVGDKGQANRPEDKSLRFYICKSKITNAVMFYETNIEWPDDTNCFVLTFNAEWNDNFSYKTRYNLYYVCDSIQNHIGEVKIIKRGSDNTSDVLPSSFYSLDSDFCSLGQSDNYYYNFSKFFKEQAYVYLAELCDVALYSRLQKEFEKEPSFISSLIRYNDAERALRLGRYIVYGRDISNAFSFQYEFIPPYNKQKDNLVVFDFNFTKDIEYYRRAIALIGENGVGKSCLMKKMVKEIVTNNNENFRGLNPLFSCVMAITYSPFDDYPLSDSLKGKTIDYEYCGLVDHLEEENNRIIKKDLLTKDKQIKIFVKNVHVILERKEHLISTWIENVLKVINQETLEKAINFKESIPNYTLNDNGLEEMFEKASSGESIFLSVISSILAKIRYDSILFLDEPEQHLHPAGITVLISSIMGILERYNSFAVISTHSPFIIREIPSSNVKILHRKNERLYSSPIGIESFGEEVSAISNFVFEDLDREKRYEEIIEKLSAMHNYNFEKIIETLQNNGKSLGLNTLLKINSIIRKNKEQ